MNNSRINYNHFEDIKTCLTVLCISLVKATTNKVNNPVFNYFCFNNTHIFYVDLAWDKIMEESLDSYK